MAYSLTQSLELVAASSQYARKSSPTGFSSGSAARTIEGWFRYAGTGEQSLGGYGTDSGSQGEFSISIDATPELYVRLNGGNIRWTATGATDGGWHHFAVTHDGSGSVSSTATKAYLDGAALSFVATGGTTTVNTVNTYATVGASNAATPSNFWDENISLYRIWTVARSSTDISNNMCNVLGATTNLVAEWTLDNTYTDNSGTGNGLTSSGSPTFSSDVPATCVVAVAGNALMFGHFA